MRISPRVLVLFALVWLLWAPVQSHAAPTSRSTEKSRGQGKKKSTPPRSAPIVHRAAPERPHIPATLSFPVVQHRLPSGMRVILQPDSTTTAVAVSLAYRAGSSQEAEGEYGFSSALREHLRAAQPAASTSVQYTPDLLQFTTVVLPSRLANALWREAHRIHRPIRQTGAIALRNHLDFPPSPSVRAQTLAFQGCSPYGHLAHGWTPDLQQASAEYLDAYRRRWAQPALAALAVAGAFDPDAVLEQVQQYFAPIRPSAIPSDPPIVLPDQTNQRVDIDRFDTPVPQVFLYGWAVPPAGHADLAAIRLLIELFVDRPDTIGSRHSPRLAKLSTEASVSMELEERKGPSWLTFRVDLPANVDMDATRKVVDDAFLDLVQHGPTQEELDAGWRAAQRRLLRSVERVEGRASLLARSALLRDDAIEFFEQPAQLAAVRREDVQRVARQILSPIRRNLVEIRGPRIDSPKKAEQIQKPNPLPSHGSKQPASKKKQPTKQGAPRRSNKPSR